MVKDEEDELEKVVDVIIVEDVFSESKAGVRDDVAINRAETGGKDPDRERENRSVI